MCRHWQEDCFHVVVDCPHAQALWLVMRERWCLPPEEKLRNVEPEWFLVLLDLYKPDVMANLALVLWRAWSVRNKVTRADERLSIDDYVEFLIRLSGELDAEEDVHIIDSYGSEGYA
jgi:hypothetical protein